MDNENYDMIKSLLPVTTKIKTTQDAKNILLYNMSTFLVSKDGQAIDVTSYPKAWIEYMVESMNGYLQLKNELKKTGYKIKTEYIVGTIVIPNKVLPITESKIITKDKDERYRISYSPEYIEWIEQARKEKYIMRKALSPEKLPLGFPIRLEMTFYVHRDRLKSAISEYIDSALEVLVKIGIIKSKTIGVVRAVDGSKVKYTKTIERTVVVIRTALED